MAVSTFGGIKTAVIDWIDATAGGGLTTTVIANDIFPQMQSQMYYGDIPPKESALVPIPPLRIRAMIDSATITPDTGGSFSITSNCGAGWLEFQELVPTTAGSPSLDYMDPWQFRKQVDALQSTTGPQFIYTVEDGTVYLAPAAVTTVSAKWYEKFTALSADGDTDWIVTNAPQVYMMGCMYWASIYTGDDRVNLFRAHFASAIKALNMNDQRQRAGGSTPVARPRTVA